MTKLVVYPSTDGGLEEFQTNPIKVNQIPNNKNQQFHDFIKSSALVNFLELTWIEDKKVIYEIFRCVKKETRITITSAILIDHIITNNFMANEVSNDFSMVSDHEMIGTKVNITGAEIVQLFWEEI